MNVAACAVIGLASLVVQLASAVPTFTCPNPPTNAANLYPDPVNTNRFYQCSNGIAYNLPCAKSTFVFNPTTSTCAPAVGCPADTGPAGLYPDPEDCTHYYQCSNNIPYHMPCPAGLYFNPTLYVCDWPSNVVTSSPAFVFLSNGDNEHWVYADGVLLGHLAYWPQSLSVNVPAGTQTLAVKIVDVGAIGGLLGSSADGTLVTDSSWKCTRTPGAGDWTAANFDDSHWPQADADHLNGQLPIWGKISSIDDKAFWIWNKPYETNSSRVEVYCRKRLSAARQCKVAA